MKGSSKQSFYLQISGEEGGGGEWHFPLNFDKIKKNLHFLTTETNAHLHVDLIIGLPGETVESFANNLKISFFI